MLKRLVVQTVALVFGVASLAGCSDVNQVPQTSDLNAASSESPSGIASPSSEPEPGGIEPGEIDAGSSSQTPSVDQNKIPTYQAPKDGDALVAWEALMGSDGEYAAAASYTAVIEKYGQVEPYVTILAAEERHIDALTRQLTRMGVTVPQNPYLGRIVAPDSLQQAAQAWAEGEIANVAMYDALLKRTSDPNLTKVLTNLRRSSLESHLPLFEQAAENGGTLDNVSANGSNDDFGIC